MGALYYCLIQKRRKKARKNKKTRTITYDLKYLRIAIFQNKAKMEKQTILK